MFPSFIHLQELGEVGVDDGDGTTNTGKQQVNQALINQKAPLAFYL